MMSGLTDVIVFGLTSADAANSLEQGTGPAGYAGSVVSVAASAGPAGLSGAQYLGVAQPGIQAVTTITRAVSGAGAIGAGLTAVQIAIDISEGKDIKVGDVIAVGTAIPIGIAVAVGLIGTSSVLVPLAMFAGVAAAIMNFNDFELSDIFAKFNETVLGRELTTQERQNLDNFLDANYPSGGMGNGNNGLPLLFDVPGLGAGGGLGGGVDLQCNRDYFDGVRARPPVLGGGGRDPLAIDLDGDGIETEGIGSTPVLFDHDADHVRTGTGWVSPDDAWLVLDRNNNGNIDTGRELFGVDTVISGTPGVDAVYASTGFEALRTLDSNHDNVFDSQDASFGQVRLWQDTNQDGVSQANELFTLSEKNIVSISLLESSDVIDLGNGNVVSGTATVTRNDATTTLASAVSVTPDTLASNLILQNNPFYREFTDPVELTAAAEFLPDMNGSGWVRNLREAMSLGSSQSLSLTSKVQEYSSAATRDEQLAFLDDLLRLWAETDTVHLPASVDDPSRRFVLNGDPVMSARMQNVISILEVFNGTPLSGAGMQDPEIFVNPDGSSTTTYQLFAQQPPAMLIAYEHLRESVYGSLAMQTRLKPYMNSIDLSFGPHGVAFDSTSLALKLETYRELDEREALIDLVELNRYGSTFLREVGFSGTEKLRNWISEIPAGSELRTLLASLNVRLSGGPASMGADIYIGNSNTDGFSAASGNDIVDGGGGDDYLHGNDGSDLLLGGSGNDQLVGGSQWRSWGVEDDDVLDGGTGNDHLVGGFGSDTYLFGRGDGQDVISNDSYSWDTFEANSSDINVLQFKDGVSSEDIQIRRFHDQLILSIYGTSDQITVNSYFSEDGFSSSGFALSELQFSDGAAWDLATVKLKALVGGAGDDTLTGYATNDDLSAFSGNDYLEGRDGNDTLDGGEGNDLLDGGAGNDTYVYDLFYGNDTIRDATGIDVIKLGGSLNTGTVELWRDSYSLYLSVLGSSDQLMIEGWFDATENRVEGIEFSDLVRWDTGTLAAAKFRGTTGQDTLHGTTANDVVEGLSGMDSLYGDYGNDSLYGGGDADYLQGGQGDDTLDGGAGDDYQEGGDGDDTYLFGIGYGQDLIVETSGSDAIRLEFGISESDVVLWRDSSSLYLQIAGTTDRLMISGWFDALGSRVESIRFENGAVWSTAVLESAPFYGTQADDSIVGSSGNDTLDGKGGNDYLEGGTGNDTYFFGYGSGQDTVSDASGNDVIKLGAGLTTENVKIWRDTSSLYVQLVGTNDRLTVAGWFDQSIHRVEEIQFADNTVLDAAALAAAKFIGTESSDSIIGTAENDFLEGRGGNDYLSGDLGNDTLYGGAENDSLDGGEGDDVYLFESGFGQDAIVDTSGIDVVRFGNGIAATDVTLWRDTSNLYIGVVGTTDMLTVTGWFDATSSRVESVEFSDGTMWNALTLSRANFMATEGADSLHGSEGDDVVFGAGGNDSLYGNGGADTLDGGSGSDTLEGGDGNDTYIFEVGYGHDTIADSSGIDAIKLGLNLTPENVEVWRDASNLYVGVVGTPDVLTVTGWFDAVDSRVESLQFEDGSIWGEAVLAVARYVGTESGDTLTGTTGNDHLEGNGGDDTLTGDLGNDILDGGTGSDSLDGGAGDDTYVFGLGYGQDFITDISGTDTIKLGAGLTPENVQIWRDTSNLYLQITGTNDLLTVTGWFDSTANRVESILFADDTTWSTATLAAAKFAGTSGDDYITGTAGNDTIDGGAGNDTVDGGAGNDTYIFSLGYGQDSITDASGTDVIKLGAGLTTENVQIWRDTSNLYLQITGTSDVLTVTGWFDAAANRVESIQFADNTTWNTATLAAAKFVGTESGDAINGTTGNDVLEGRGGDDSLSGDLGNDTLDGGTGNDFLDGGAGNDSYIFDIGYGLDSITDSAGTDVVKFGAGVTPANVQMWRDTSNLYVGILGTNDLLTITGWFDATANRVESFLFADSTVWNAATLAAAPFGGTSGADYLYGTTGNNTLYGFGGNDSIYADAGHDILDGGTGNDLLDGAAGNDTYVFGRGYGQDTITESAGTDVIQFNADTAAADVLVSRDASNLYLAIQGTQDKITVQNFYTATSYQTEQVKFSDGTIWTTAMLNTRMSTATEAADFLWGTTANNTFNGLGGNDQLFGNEGNDVLNGGDGDDLLNGGTGNDTMAGGTGDDVYVVDSILDVVTENTAEGIDTVQSSITLTLASNVENLALTGAAAINGTGNALDNAITGNSADNVLTGAAGNDTLHGGEGNDTLDGGVGDDVMAGGLGNDIYVVDSTADTVSELLGEGSDTVQSSISYVLGANVEKLTLTGAAVINGTGNELANTLVGNSAANALDGGAGNDSLNGGAGADTLIGGLGNDSYTVDNVGDVVVENEGGGTDTVTSSISYVLGAHVERLTLSGSGALSGTGNSLDNILNGNSGANSLSGGAGNDIIDGKAGADTMAGGIGDDSYVVDNVGDAVVETFAEGTDSVTSSITYTLTSNVENLSLSGTAAINGTGNELGNVVTGNSAINILDGGAGADTLIGGLGDDIYLVDDAGDVIVEETSEGVDTVQSTATAYVLSANLERLTLMGSADISGTGNDLDNLMTGNSGANTLNGAGGNDTLDGGAGADTLIGGLGNDTYLIENSADVIIEAENEGLDVVQSSVTYVLSAHVENITLTGTAAINATGNASDNVIVGNTGVNVLVGGDGNDTLDGKAGADTMLGGAGNDTYTVDNVGDVVTENTSEGIDLINSSVTHTLGANVENLTLTGSAAINATGNAEDNVLTGNSSANVLVGGDGNDTLDGKAGADNMTGGLGNDIYFVDHINDVVTELADQGIDTVNSSIAYVLGGTLENLTLTGSAAVSGTGNALDNILTGNSGVNTLTGGAGNDTLDGKAGADTLIGGQSDDVYVVDNAGDIVTENAGEGLDQVRSTVAHTLAANVEVLVLTGTSSVAGTGNAGDNMLHGNTGNNALNGGAGNDIIQGGSGTDTLIDTDGNNLLDGGAGTDTLTGGAGNDFLIGGAGNDTINTGIGFDIIAFNRGDGMDNVNLSTGGDNTLSLGGGITYADLLFKKSSNDLILVTGTNEQVTFKGWYTSTDNRSVANLQVVIEGTSDYDAGSSDPLSNKKIEQFDFGGLVTKFDQARVANPALTNWALSSSLLEFYLNSSDTAALGGDLAYQYAKSGNLSDVSMSPAQALLAGSSFGSGAQNLQANSALQDLSPRLV